MEEEKPHALEMGKEEAQANEKEAETKSRRTLDLAYTVGNSHSFSF